MRIHAIQTGTVAVKTRQNQDLMLRGVIDGVSPDDTVARTTLERIRSFASSTSTVYAVAHDPDTGRRVAERAVIETRQLEMIAQ